MNLLVRFYDPKTGAIRIDRHDTRDLTLDCLRDQLGLVMQTPLLFSARSRTASATGGSTPRWTTSSAAPVGELRDFISTFPRLDTSSSEAVPGCRAATPTDRGRARVHPRRADPDPRRADIGDRLRRPRP
jgi:hypothetical protein